MRKRVHTVVTVTAIIMVIGLVAWMGFAWRSTPIPTLYREARIALMQRDFERCEDLCKQVLSQSPDHEAALLLAGESAMRSTRYEDALNYFQAITEIQYRRIDQSSVRKCRSAASIGAYLGSGDWLSEDYHQAATACRSTRTTRLYPGLHGTAVGGNSTSAAATSSGSNLILLPDSIGFSGFCSPVSGRTGANSTIRAGYLGCQPR